MEDHPLARADGQPQAGHAGHAAGPRPGRVDDPVGLDLPSIGQADAGRTAAVPLHLDHLAGDLLDAERAGLASECLEQGIGVEPALVGQAQRAAGQVVDLHPREAGLQLGRRQEHDVDAVLALHGVVALEDRDPRLGRQEEVAALHEVDLGGGLPSTPSHVPGCLITSTPKRLISMFSGVLNWRRIEAAERVVDEVRKVRSRSTTTIRPCQSGRRARKVAVALPTMAPPTITTSARSGLLTRRS